MTAAPRPKALLLDLGNVTVRLRLGPFFERVGAACDPPLDPVRLSDKLAEGALGHADYERGRLDAAAWHGRLVSALGLRMGYADWFGLWNDTFEPNEAMHALLKDLRGQVRVWGLSNTNVDHLRRLRQGFGVMDFFEGVTASCEVGARKPETALYAAALASLRLEPREVLYLDDVEAFVGAARTLGMDAFHYTFNDAALRERLKNRGFDLA